MSMLRTNMSWDQHQSLELLNEFKKYEILWNTKHKAYFSSVKKEEAWRELATTFNVDVSEVKRKIDSLRGSYRREKSRTRRSEAVALLNGGIGAYVSNWFAFEAMTFLDSHETKGNWKSDPLRCITKEEPDTIYFNETDEHSPLEDNDNEPDGQEDLFHNGELPNPLVSPLRLKRKKSHDDSVSHKAYKLLKQVSVKKDECGFYGDYIAEKLRKMNDFYRVQTQHKINNAIFEIEMAIFKNQEGLTPRSQPSPPQDSQESQNTSFDASDLKCEVILSDLND